MKGVNRGQALVHHGRPQSGMLEPVDHKLCAMRPSRRSASRYREEILETLIIGVDFDDKNAIPDVLGKAQREACAAYLSSAVQLQRNELQANAILAVAKGGDANDPIALLILSSEANIRTYNAGGVHIGDTLPAGSYVVLPTKVSSTAGGTPTALFLVSLGGDTYLIPSTVMQGFGKGSIGNTGQAGIRDGFARYRLFGW